MQNKGAVRAFAIILALVCLYQLSFTFFTKKVESDAKEAAAGDIQKEAAYLDSIANEPIYNFLWLKKYTYMECKGKEINFGLDLKGGMNLVLEVKVSDVVKAFGKRYGRNCRYHKNSKSDRGQLFKKSAENFCHVWNPP